MSHDMVGSTLPTRGLLLLLLSLSLNYRGRCHPSAGSSWLHLIPKHEPRCGAPVELRVLVPSQPEDRYLIASSDGGTHESALSRSTHPLVLHDELPIDLTVQLFCDIESRVSALVHDGGTAEAVQAKCAQELMHYRPLLEETKPSKVKCTSEHETEQPAELVQTARKVGASSSVLRYTTARDATATLRVDTMQQPSGASDAPDGRATFVCIGVAIGRAASNHTARNLVKDDGDSIIDRSRPLSYGVKIGTGSWYTVSSKHWPFREADGGTGVCPDHTLFGFLDSGAVNTTVQLVLVDPVRGYPLTDILSAGILPMVGASSRLSSDDKDDMGEREESFGLSAEAWYRMHPQQLHGRAHLLMLQNYSEAARETRTRIRESSENIGSMRNCKPRRPSTESFVSFSSVDSILGNGMTNQRQRIVMMLVVAKLLGRTLVAPRLQSSFTRDALGASSSSSSPLRGSSLAVDELYDIEALTQTFGVRVVSGALGARAATGLNFPDQEVAVLRRFGRLDTYRCALEDALGSEEEQQQQQQQQQQQLEREKSNSSKHEPSRWLLLTNGPLDADIFLNAFADDARDEYAAASEALRFSDVLRQTANAMAVDIPKPFLALHARVEDDWQDHCQELEQQLMGAVKVCASVAAVARAAIETATSGGSGGGSGVGGSESESGSAAAMSSIFVATGQAWRSRVLQALQEQQAAEGSSGGAGAPMTFVAVAPPEEVAARASPPSRVAASSLGMAAVDMIICTEYADLFLGTSYSSFASLVAASRSRNRNRGPSLIYDDTGDGRGHAAKMRHDSGLLVEATDAARAPNVKNAGSATGPAFQVNV